MTESSASYPDLSANRAENDDFDQVLIEYACWKIYRKIEQGLEEISSGLMTPDSKIHKAEYEQKLAEIERYINKQGKPHPEPVCSGWGGGWPGV
jgi:hypothetical protein